MSRRPRHAPLRVYLNNRLVGYLLKDPGGAIAFRYDQRWLDWEHALPVSLSLPLREDAYRGAAVVAVFENLLPDSKPLRERVAEKVGAQGSDAYSLLASIGRDCVGALRFVADDDADENIDSTAVEGEAIAPAEIERLLGDLAGAPLGMDRDDEFRISIAGAHEKTALLRRDGRWFKPRGATPTTHILKPPIGRLANGIDLSHSVENEYYCLRLVAAFGLPASAVEIHRFGQIKALVIERFDRRWTNNGRLIRLPQEDCCQALSVAPTLKYQSDGGPGMVDILRLLKGSDAPAEDQKMFLKAQFLFWLIGAADGHAKNFSIFLGPGGSYSLTPLYDVLSAQPSLDARQIERKQMKLAMAVGDRRHYRIAEIQPRHFLQTAAKTGLPKSLVQQTMEEITAAADDALNRVEQELPADFPEAVHASVSTGLRYRLRVLDSPEEIAR